MADRATQLLARRGLPFDHPKVLADRVRRGLIPAAHVDLSADVANWRDWPKGALSDRVWRLYAADCAERALAQVEEPDPRSLEAIRVARRYAVGEATREELGAAGAAAEAAAEDAAADAAWDAAWDAAADAAWAAAWDAAWSAAWEAAWVAARAAAWDAWRSWQDRHLRRCLLLPTWPDWRETK